MGSNTFGKHFQITTWGESHGPAIGVVIDGCPAGLEISAEEIDRDLAKRAPGKSPYTSPRKEPDKVEILSGVFEGRTTGTPISLMIRNQDVDSSKYSTLRDVYRPGHANFTYEQKYGLFDHRGGGRASARETACRVAAGAVARKLVCLEGIKVSAELVQQGAIRENDSAGGIVEVVAMGLPVGLGDPVYEKLEAELAHAMLSINASKGFEIGSGFRAASMAGSENNDLFVKEGDQIVTKTNNAGGVLGGISNGMPLVARVAFKPTSSINQPQETCDREGNPVITELPKGSRMDPCLAIRAVPVVEAMCILVLADRLLAFKAQAPINASCCKQ